MDMYEKRPHTPMPTSNRSKRRRYLTVLTILVICGILYLHKDRNFGKFDIPKKYYTGYKWSRPKSSSSHSVEHAEVASSVDDDTAAKAESPPLINSSHTTSENASSVHEVVNNLAETAAPERPLEYEKLHHDVLGKDASESSSKSSSSSFASSTTSTESAATAESTFTSDTITIDRENSTEHPESSSPSSSKFSSHHRKQDYTTTIVLGRMSSDAERVKWVYDDLNNITTRMIYIVDDPNTPEPHLERNHGREGMVYMKYIIDNYDNLNDITFFWHSDRKVWHNNMLLGEDSVNTINRMDREVIMQQGYVPSRCDHWPGCPSWIKFNPSRAEHKLDHHRLSDMFSPQTFSELFPEEKDYPRYFASTCCSQFAVSRDTIHANKLEDYIRIRDWIENWFSDQYTGRALELLWQYIFLRKGEYCPSMEDCYCRTYGLCLNDRAEAQMLDRWNELRTRAEELQWQQWYRWNELTEQGLDKEGHNLEDDPEHRRLTDEMMEMRQKQREYKNRIIRHWDLPGSEVEW